MSESQCSSVPKPEEFQQSPMLGLLADTIWFLQRKLLNHESFSPLMVQFIDQAGDIKWANSVVGKNPKRVRAALQTELQRRGARAYIAICPTVANSFNRVPAGGIHLHYNSSKIARGDSAETLTFALIFQERDSEWGGIWALQATQQYFLTYASPRTAIIPDAAHLIDLFSADTPTLRTSRQSGQPCFHAMSDALIFAIGISNAQLVNRGRMPECKLFFIDSAGKPGAFNASKLGIAMDEEQVILQQVLAHYQAQAYVKVQANESATIEEGADAVRTFQACSQLQPKQANDQPTIKLMMLNARDGRTRTGGLWVMLIDGTAPPYRLTPPLRPGNFDKELDIDLFGPPGIFSGSPSLAPTPEEQPVFSVRGYETLVESMVAANFYAHEQITQQGRLPEPALFYATEKTKQGELELVYPFRYNDVPTEVSEMRARLRKILTSVGAIAYALVIPACGLAIKRKTETGLDWEFCVTHYGPCTKEDTFPQDEAVVITWDGPNLVAGGTRSVPVKREQNKILVMDMGDAWFLDPGLALTGLVPGVPETAAQHDNGPQKSPDQELVPVIIPAPQILFHKDMTGKEFTSFLSPLRSSVPIVTPSTRR